MKRFAEKKEFKPWETQITVRPMNKWCDRLFDSVAECIYCLGHAVIFFIWEQITPYSFVCMSVYFFSARRGHFAFIHERTQINAAWSKQLRTFEISVIFGLSRFPFSLFLFRREFKLRSSNFHFSSSSWSGLILLFGIISDSLGTQKSENGPKWNAKRHYHNSFQCANLVFLSW